MEELENISRALRGFCIAWIEQGVAEACRHPEEVGRFLHAMADAIDGQRERRVRRGNELALGVDPETGEWLAGA